MRYANAIVETQLSRRGVIETVNSPVFVSKELEELLRNGGLR